MISSDQNKNIKILISPEVLEFLCDDQFTIRKKYSKLLAFYSLVYKCQIKIMLGNNSCLLDQDVQQLSDLWSWNRSTTKKFLLRLQELNAVELIKVGKRWVPKLTVIIHAENS